MCFIVKVERIGFVSEQEDFGYQEWVEDENTTQMRKDLPCWVQEHQRLALPISYYYVSLETDIVRKTEVSIFKL